MTYGIGYQGSKNRIAKDIVDALPSADCFVDLFAGGCAVAHAAALSGKYKIVIANDIDEAPKLFLRALNGEFENTKDFITKKDFDDNKFKDAYIRYVWSFGNNGFDYMYNKNNELEMKNKHLSVADDFSKYNSKTMGRIVSIERLKRLRGISKSELQADFIVLQLDYKEVKIPPNSIVYCDIPYKNTRGYTYLEKIFQKKSFFNHNEFYDYCKKLKKKNIPCFISEYDMPSESFKSIWTKKKFVALNRVNTRKHKIEQIFIIR